MLVLVIKQEQIDAMKIFFDKDMMRSPPEKVLYTINL
jgi:hypothetical protein